MQYSLVAVVFQMFLVPVVRQHVLWVVFSDPLCLLNIKRAGLSLHLLSFSASRYWSRQTCGSHIPSS